MSDRQQGTPYTRAAGAIGCAADKLRRATDRTYPSCLQVAHKVWAAIDTDEVYQRMIDDVAMAARLMSQDGAVGGWTCLCCWLVRSAAAQLPVREMMPHVALPGKPS